MSEAQRLEFSEIISGIVLEGEQITERSDRISNSACWDKEPFWEPWSRALKKKSTLEISVIENSQRSNVTKTDDILRVFEAFYRDLYQKHPQSKLDEDAYEGMGKVDPVIANLIMSPLLEKELEKVLATAANGKAAGMDGIPVELYKRFWPDLKEWFLEIYNNIIETGTFEKGFTNGYTVLLPKTGDLTDVKNWRPITILNADYKILSKLLVSRLEPALKGIIHRTQTYSLEGRSMIENLCATRDLIWYARIAKKPLVVVTIDQAKAYDRVSHTHVENLLRKIELPEDVISLLLHCITDGETHLAVNGKLSRAIPINRGVRQGDPMSGLLFNLTSEPLANELRKSLMGDSFQIGSEKCLMSAYADDVSLFLKSIDAVPKVVQAYRKAGKASGAGINLEKSKCLVLNIKDPPATCENIPVKTSSVKILGILFGSYNQDRKMLNALILKLSREAARIYPLLVHTTLKVKVIALNAFIISRIVFVMQTINFTPKYIKAVKTIMNNCIWGVNSRRWVKQETLTLGLDEGGLGVPDLEVKQIALRAKRVARILYGSHESIEFKVTKGLLEEETTIGIGQMLFCCSEQALKGLRLPPEYHTMWKALTSLQISAERPELFSFLRQPTYYNRGLLGMDINFDNVIGSTCQLSIFKLLTEETVLRNRSSLKNDVARSVREEWGEEELFTILQSPQGFTNGQNYEEFWSKWQVQDPNTLSSFPFAHLSCKFLYNVLISKKVRPEEVNQQLPWASLFQPYVPGRWSDITFRKWHGRLLTPRREVKMGLTSQNICLMCKEQQVADDHIFACPKLRQLRRIACKGPRRLRAALKEQCSEMSFSKLKKNEKSIGTALMSLLDFVTYRTYVTNLECNKLKAVKRPSHLYCSLLNKYVKILLWRIDSTED